LKRQLAAWNAVLEFRIHLESALAAGHRLPMGKRHALFCAASTGVSSEAAATSADLRDLLGTLLETQQRVVECRGMPFNETPGDTVQKTSPDGQGGSEAKAWDVVEGRLQRILGWELGIADAWKERTKLDVRRSFKVLDQSLALQMNTLDEADVASKLRKRCVPPVGRHKIYGARQTQVELQQADEAVVTTQNEGRTNDNERAPPEEEIYDDRDFYAQLLREVLAGGSLGSNADSAAREVQADLGKRSQNKRADVDRRASKGRKIRYVSIEKLQNFMAQRPRSVDTEVSMDAMLAGLFAKATGS